MNWDERFELAKAYYEHHGDLRVVISFKTKNGYEYDEEGFDLGRWINRQRHQYKIGQATPEHYKKLMSIGMIYEDLSALDWENFYKMALIYLEHHGELPVSHNFKTTNGYTYDEKGKSLGAWFNVQRMNYNHKKLSEERMQKIDALFKKFYQIKDEQHVNEEIEWNKMYKLALSYYKYHGHLNVPVKFTTNNGYEYDEEGKNLGKWIRSQRKRYRCNDLTEEQIKRLEETGMVFSDIALAEWDRMYTLAKAYYEHHKNLKVPRWFNTKNGYEYDKDGSKLGKWVNTQYCRNLDGYMTEEEYNKLIAIGMNFENKKEINWEKMYKLAKAYYEHHKNLSVLISFKTKNGYEYDENGINLGAWLFMQKRNYLTRRLSEKKFERLKSIGMFFGNLNDSRWEKMYNLAKTYYEHYKNLLVDIGFKTKNGYEYDEEGENLGVWIVAQRTEYKNHRLYQERFDKLQMIGMVFEIRNNSQQNRVTCVNHNIDYVTYKKEIDSIPHREFISKINYLSEQGIPVTTDDGLHPIFFMSSMNMEVRYGISLEELILKCQPTLQKVKRG